MKIPSIYHKELKRLHDQDGATKEVPIEVADWLLGNRLVQEYYPTPQEYRLKLTPRGIAAVTDRPK